eukprot:3434436-Pyramimonas_sp.AAC.1
MSYHSRRRIRATFNVSRVDVPQRPNALGEPPKTTRSSPNKPLLKIALPGDHRMSYATKGRPPCDQRTSANN